MLFLVHEMLSFFELHESHTCLGINKQDAEKRFMMPPDGYFPHLEKLERS